MQRFSPPSSSLFRHRSCRGGAMVEFSLALVVILLLLMGMVEVDRLFTEMSWFTVTNYNTVLAGAELNSTTAPDNVDNTFTRLYDIYGRELANVEDPEIDYQDA